MIPSRNTSDRAVAPVVGVALLIAITVILAAVIGSVVLGIGVGPVNSPQATLSFSLSDNDTVKLIHEGGDRLAAEEVAVVNEAGYVYEGLTDDLVAGQREPIAHDVQQGERLSVVWQDPSSDNEVILATFRV